ncbi:MULTISPECIES: sigma-70 family RNA polymerase sigma factor [Clostridium]|uniref:sigma-70 family RNA polymerase sigma factor n=1 Tax=Clostridium TaxID=1485 RepID=UPI0008250698|nr:MULTISPECIES: sigma-70 family RNA polymerase sigma factor [Clostridium]PJI06806.1 RNA polymerase subunit sigma-24 [Clostridium sp. CT7]
MEQSNMLNHLDKSEDRKRVFAYVFETYSKRVYNYIYYRVNSNYNEEDLMIKVFEKAMLKIELYSEEKSSFEVWLFAIAKNVLNDYFRSLKRHTLFSLDTIKELISKQPSPEDTAIIRETNDKLLNCLKILSEKERNIIALKFGANLKNMEIAEILDTSSSNVGVILFHSMKKLRREMEREGYVHE